MNTKCIVLFVSALGAVAGALHAGPRSSANYNILTDALDYGGVIESSANYQNLGSAGLISGIATTTPGAAVIKSGYIAQVDFDDNNPPLINISGTISYCSNPALPSVPNVTLTLAGSMSGSTLSDGSGNYTLSSLAPGGNYVVTPSKTALLPASAGINTVDVIATQRHFLVLGTPLTGCKLTAADVNLDTSVNTVDVIAIQRFFLGLSTGIAQTGKYKFTPLNRTYTGLVTNQTAQNYDALIFGDVATTFVHRPEGRQKVWEVMAQVQVRFPLR
jgi:hypothetical protein